MEIEGSLRFTDRRDGGAFPVHDANGIEVARIKTGRAGTRFNATDNNGALLCAGVAGWLGLSGVWRMSGPGGQPLLTVRKSPLRARAVASLDRGDDLVIRGNVWKRDFQVTDAAGAVILTAVPSSASLSLQPHEYMIQQPEHVLGLAEVVSIVATWRLIRKSDNAALAGTAVTGVLTAGR
jgi:uncharacterized protein YxjI